MTMSTEAPEGIPPAVTSQTAGPYWHMVDFPEWADLTRPGGPNAGVKGERIVLTGRIVDGAGEPVSDAMVEIVQAGPDGQYDGAFTGFGRCASDGIGRYCFVTLKPGPVPGLGNQTQAPHIVVSIFARGLMTQVVTRAYFAGEALNADDPVLNLVPPERRATMIAEAGVMPNEWRLDIRLQGEGETVFLDV
jgi:protocatechuate 3,4-dioxygenase, alpha subunit